MWPFKSKVKAHPSAFPIFKSLEKQRGVLDKPVEVDQHIHLSCTPTELFAWGIFNPYGPTLSMISLLNHDESEVALVHHRMLNPFLQESEVVAVVDSGASIEDSTECLMQLFAENTMGETCLIGALPTFLLFGKAEDTVQLCVDCLHSHITANNRTAEMLDNLETFQKFKANPWDRATNEQKRALQQMLAEKTGNPVPLARQASVAYDPDQFLSWAKLLWSDEHALPEKRGFLEAWKGSIHVQKGNDLAQTALSMQDLITLLASASPLMFLQLSSAIERGDGNG
jgi:hypothetical protein